MLTSRGTGFIGSGLALFFGGLVSGYQDLTRVGALLLLLVALVIVTHHARTAPLRTRRVTLPTKLSLGQPATVHLSIHNDSSRRQKATLITEEVAPGAGDRHRALLGPLGPGSESVLQYPIRPRMRGLHTLGPTWVTVLDSLGLTHRSHALEGTNDVLVLPTVHALSGATPNGRAVGRADNTSAAIALQGEEDIAVREYRLGDDRRRIHWPATARAGDLMVRQEERPTHRTAVVLLDPRSSAHSGVGPSSSFEWAVSAAASVVSHLSGMGYTVRLVSRETVVDGQAGPSSTLTDMLGQLAMAQLSDRSDLSELVRAAHSLTTQGGIIVTILGSSTPADIGQVASIRNANITGLAMLIDAHGSWRGSTSGTVGTGGTGHAGQPPAAADLSAQVSILERAGFSSVVVDPALPVAGAWHAVTGGRWRG